MSWRIWSGDLANLPKGSQIKASCGENVLYGTFAGFAPSGRLILNLPNEPYRTFRLHPSAWVISIEVQTMWDVMVDAEIGTTAQAKDGTGYSDAVYLKTAAGVVNSRTLSKVQSNSAIATAEAKHFRWTEPKSWFPSSE